MDRRGSHRGTATAVAFALLFGGGGLAPTSGQAQTQTRSRDVTITGPRGRTVERQLQSTVGPGGIDRRMTVTRPGGSISREFQATRPAMPMPRPMPGPPRGGMGALGGPPRNVFIERNVFVNGGGGRGGLSGAEAFGLGALGAAVGAGAGVLVGKALSSPPPPQPVIVAGPPVVVAGPPLVAGPPMVVASPPPTVVYQHAAPAPPDEVSEAITRLGSWHENSRKQAAYVLGRLGDPRAVPALVDVLKTDRSANVRIAAVSAIAQIGDPSSAVYLERVSVYDKKQEVRDAALAALARMPREVPAQAQAQPAPTSGTTGSGWSTPSNRSQPPELEPAESVPPPPTPVGARSTGGRRS